MFYSRNYVLNRYDIEPNTLKATLTPVPVTWSVREFVLPAFDDRASVDQYAALASWGFELPLVSPLSDRFALTLVHLRNIRGARPVVKLFPAATHEIVFAMCDPRVDGWERGRFGTLRPLNHVAQISVRYDHAARWLCEQIARAMVEGRLVAEPDGIKGAREHFLAHCKEWQSQAARIFKSDI